MREQPAARVPRPRLLLVPTTLVHKVAAPQVHASERAAAATATAAAATAAAATAAAATAAAAAATAAAPHVGDDAVDQLREGGKRREQRGHRAPVKPAEAFLAADAPVGRAPAEGLRVEGAEEGGEGEHAVPAAAA